MNTKQGRVTVLASDRLSLTRYIYLPNSIQISQRGSKLLSAQDFPRSFKGNNVARRNLSSFLLVHFDIFILAWL